MNSSRSEARGVEGSLGGATVESVLYVLPDVFFTGANTHLNVLCNGGIAHAFGICFWHLAIYHVQPSMEVHKDLSRSFEGCILFHSVGKYHFVSHSIGGHLGCSHFFHPAI